MMNLEELLARLVKTEHEAEELLNRSIASGDTEFFRKNSKEISNINVEQNQVLKEIVKILANREIQRDKEAKEILDIYKNRR